MFMEDWNRLEAIKEENASLKGEKGTLLEKLPRWKNAKNRMTCSFQFNACN